MSALQSASPTASRDLAGGFQCAPEQAARLGLFLSVTQIPVSFIRTVMGYVTFGLGDPAFVIPDADGRIRPR